MVKYWMLSPETTNTLTTSINILMGILDFNKKYKEIKGAQIRNEVNMSLFTDDIHVKVEKTNEPSKKPLTLIQVNLAMSQDIRSTYKINCISYI